MDACMEQVLLGVDFPDVCGVGSCFWALCRVRAGCSATNLRSAHTTNKARRQTRGARLGPSRSTPALSPCDNYSWPGSRPWHLVYAKCGVRGWELQRGVILGLLADTKNIGGSSRRSLINSSYSKVVVFRGRKNPVLYILYVFCMLCCMFVRIWKSF